ncbi:MAG: hypothetical protein IKV41_02485 [Oscillospiraceae bacterium]|nr:hypothetical protein [Oscillospiraceae bacterium]
MATCEKLSKCPFYQGQMSMESGLGKMYKQKYCESDKASCARYMIASTLGPEFVTNNIYPNMTELAKSMIAKNKK